MSDSLLSVGKIVNTHGIRGELRVLLQTDFPEVRFAPKNRLLIIHPETGERFEVTVQTARPYKQMYIVKFAEFSHINEVEPFKGRELKVPKTESVELPENEYYFHEIIGCQVVSDEGEDLGQIVEILRPGANDVWVTKLTSGKQLLLPVIDDVVLDVNVKEKIIKVHVMEGLL
ncbi:MAG: ribosome maturation factor RimM [Paenibacillaceae bacterium]|uniref:Ribosome maturation factor RimM n=1 Tax=Paenibacillus mellifer TaxID=2937794 RepID=A0A9X1Y0V8_9BACL|nr:ribosome maturation factor RimM [Paenibacillus mellifer]MBW4840303.1 ribosome maturation factor RimM [Paenibacillaceae bacterium]MCK8487601.1 ribosome maturation factor RimM [Paenibacillus mellifer]